MRRREFLCFIGGAAATSWPLTARAQQQPVIGFLHLGTPEANSSAVAAFRKGLSEMGFFEGRNLAIEFRWGQNDRSRLAEFAADLVRRRVAVIASPGGTSASLVAKSATATIPIVFGAPADPVQAGLVASLNRPGGNVTGVSSIGVELTAKRFGILAELLPNVSRIGVLVNPNSFSTPTDIAIVRTAAEKMGRTIETITVKTSDEIDAVFPKLAQERIGALLVTTDNLFTTRRAQLVTLATRHAIPTIYNSRRYVDLGGLVSYGPRPGDTERQVGIYVGRILKGDKPGDLPVMLPTKFEFIMNLQTAKALNIEVPATLLAIADEVIE
jgi:putative ABC transport system substrate-binding protein